MVREGLFEEAAPPAVRVRADASDLRIAQLIVAHVYGVAPEAMLTGTRLDKRATEARQVAMYLAHVGLGMTLAGVARSFRRDRTTARHACRIVEDLRDDPARDRVLAWLEAVLRQAVGLRSAQQAVLS